MTRLFLLMALLVASTSFADMSKDFFQCINDGKMVEVMHLLREYPELAFVIDDDGWSPMQYAVTLQLDYFVAALMQLGATLRGLEHLWNKDDWKWLYKHKFNRPSNCKLKRTKALSGEEWATVLGARGKRKRAEAMPKSKVARKVSICTKDEIQEFDCGEPAAKVRKRKERDDEEDGTDGVARGVELLMSAIGHSRS